MDKRDWAKKTLCQLKQYMDLTHWEIRIEWVDDYEAEAKWGLVRLDSQPKSLWDSWGKGRATLFLRPDHPNLEECLWRLLTHIICRPYAGAGVWINWEGVHKLGDQMGDIFTDLLYRKRAVDTPDAWACDRAKALRCWLKGATHYWQEILGLEDWAISIHWGQREWEWWERKKIQADGCRSPLPPKPKLIAEYHITDEKNKQAQIWYDPSLMETLYSLHAAPAHELLHIKGIAVGIGHVTIMQLVRILMRLHGVLILTVTA